MALADLLAKFDPSTPVEDAWTPPSSWYHSCDFLDAERSRVFGRTWQPIARIDCVRNPGDYVAGCSFGEPWLVTRDPSLELRGFYNTCRHKGREVVVGGGRADELRCGYHGWKYGLDGTLRSAPKMAGIRGFDRAEMSLRPLRIETWGHWIFAAFSDETIPLGDRLDELKKTLDGTRWRECRYLTSKSWEIGCNWKVYVDNYLDGGYHIPTMHPSLDEQLDMSSYETTLYYDFSIQASAASRHQADLELKPSERIGGGAVYAWLFPNFMINCYGPCVDTNYVIPLGVDRCRVVYDFFFEDPNDRDFVNKSIAQADVTQKEDIEICESVQVGLGSSSYERGRYAPQLEHGDHHFHRLLAHYMAG